MSSGASASGWPSGAGEMARLIRGHDWASTPLGGIDGWPGRLRGAVELILPLGFPAIVLWGPRLVQVYNDGYARVMNGKHPGGLGQPTEECWPEVWHINGPIYERVRRGETVTVEDGLYPLARDGTLRDAWFTLSYSPLRDGDAVAGVLVTMVETTERVRAESSLRRSEARYRAFVTASSDVVYRMSADWTEMRELDGRGFLADTPEPSDGWMERYIEPEDRPAVQAAIADSIRGKHLFELEHRVRRADGTVGWTFSRAAPVLDAGGGIAEWLGAAKDVTERHEAEEARRRAEELDAFLLRFSDAVRTLADPALIQEAACRMLAEQLGTDRTLWAAIDGTTREYVTECVVEGGRRVAELPRWPLDPREPFASEHFGGRSVVYGDSASDPRIPEATRAALAERGIRAGIAVPVVVGGTLRAVLNTSQRQAPRRWRPEEVAFVEGLAGRAWSEVERARAEAGLRRSEAKYRTLFERMDEGFCILERLPGEPLDFRYVEANPAFAAQSGVDGVAGRTIREVVPGEPEPWFETYDRVLRTGEPIRFERELVTRGRLLELFAFPIPDDGGKRLAVIFTDVTERRRAEAVLRESEERQAFLLRLSDALRAEPDMDAVANRAIAMLSEHMRLDRCYVASFRMDEDRADITHQMGGDRVLPMPPAIRLSDFPAALRINVEDTLVIEDVAGAPGLSETDRRSIGSLGFGALVAATLRRGEGNPLWTLVVVSASPRRWTRGEVALVEEFAERTWAAMERARVESGLRESEERFRTLVSAIADVYYIADIAEGRLEYLSPSFEAVWGRSAAEVMEDPIRVAESLHPEDRAIFLSGKTRQVGGEPVTMEYRIRRPDGTLRWILDRSFPVGGQERARAAGVASDMTERKEAEAALRGSEERFRTLSEGIPQLVWRAVDHGEWSWASPQWCAFTGLSDEASRGWGWLEALHPDDRPAAREAWERSKATGGFETDYRVREAATGRYRFFQTRATPVRDAEGRIVEWLGTSTDVQDLRELQDRLKVLVAELQHRTRNLMGVVRSVTDKTVAGSASLRDFQARIRDRLDALTRVNGLLSRLQEGDRVSFDELLLNELRGHGVLQEGKRRSRVRLEGPEGIRLRSSTVQTLALGLHELATNALKYGALSRPEGRLEVRWELVPDGAGETRLRVEWQESGVPVPGGPVRLGYGRELIERALPYQLRAETSYELNPDGVRCVIVLPVSDGQEPGGPTGGRNG